METTPLIDVEPIARHLKLELANVRRITELLEEGNTVPFITRFRKDHTGGLDEQQVRSIEKELNREKLLAERKETILKSIESRGQLTALLAEQIRGARTLRLLEDIYLPYKPKKQSLASLARSKGLEPLATEIINGTPSTESLQDRANALVDEAKELPTANAVLEGVQHLIAEYFCNHAKLRAHLRRHLWRSGKLVSKQIEETELDDDDHQSEVASDARVTDEDEATPAQAQLERAVDVEAASGGTEHDSKPVASADGVTAQAVVDPATISESSTPSLAVTAPDPASRDAASEAVTDFQSTDKATTDKDVTAPSDTDAGETTPCQAAPGVAVAVEATSPPPPDDVSNENRPPAEAAPSQCAGPETADAETPQVPTSFAADDSVEAATIASAPEAAAHDVAAASMATNAEAPTTAAKVAEMSGSAKVALLRRAVEKSKKGSISRRDQRRETRRRRRERLVQSFKDYFNFSDPIGRLPHHRILAINRGERTKVLRVKVECPDWDKFQAEAESTFIPQDHLYHEFLKKCFHYALSRLLFPSIEREVRRELNDKAEEHAVGVFARNLRKLLLQPPLCQHRVVAIDPGFRSGCKLVALDEFGQILGHTFINLLGKEQQIQDGRAGLIDFVRQHKATAIAIGNGAACRETEALVADVLTNEYPDQEVGYLIVNEAGTSVYSTSDLGREELPDHDATVRSAVSIGRRALDPLSELVKIDPASIGVGLYQHDIKARHLRESLDAVVESCVNYVGVDVNSASPALLRYVSGLNSLTARRIYEYRQQHGPFKNREQLKDVSGIGNSTYVQAAGFLKIVDGEQPLDETWIHPESYPIATKVLEAIGFDVADLRKASRPTNVTATSEEPSTVSAAAATAAADMAEPPASEASTHLAATESAVSGPTLHAPTLDEPAREDVSAAPAAVVSAEPAITEAATMEAATMEVATAEVATTEAATTEAATTEAATTTEPDLAAAAVTVQTSPVADVNEPASAQTQEDFDLVSGTTEAATAPLAASGPPARTRKANGLAQELAEKLASVDVEKLAPELGVGKLLLKDILKALARPGRDPREDLPPPIFRRGILKLENLKPGMQLSGTVLNVVDFGAFVDIGLVDSGLIHVSRLADRYIADPHDVVSVGDILRVWVVAVDQKRRRVSLTAIEPGTEQPKPAREKRKPKEAPTGERPAGRARASKPKRFARTAEKKSKEDRPKEYKPKEYKPKGRPKPVVPITKEMEEGKEPMRTFGDLKQLFEKKKKGGST